MFSMFYFCSNVSIKKEFLRQWIWIYLWLLLKMVMLLKGLSTGNTTSKECTHIYQNFTIFDGDHFYNVILYAFQNCQSDNDMYDRGSSINVLIPLIKTLDLNWRFMYSFIHLNWFIYSFIHSKNFHWVQLCNDNILNTGYLK